MNRQLLYPTVLIWLLAGCAQPHTRLAPVDELAVEDAQVGTATADSASATTDSDSIGLPQPGGSVVRTLPLAEIEPVRALDPAVGTGLQLEILPATGTSPSSVADPAPAPAPVPAPMATPAPVPETWSDTAPAPTTLSSAAAALVADADRRSSEGQHDSAAASLERALQVSPQNAWLWHRLARERLAQGRGAEAESLANRSISLANRNPSLVSANWRLIAGARRLAGDAAGATEAERQAASVSGGQS